MPLTHSWQGPNDKKIGVSARLVLALRPDKICAPIECVRRPVACEREAGTSPTLAESVIKKDYCVGVGGFGFFCAVPEAGLAADADGDDGV